MRTRMLHLCKSDLVLSVTKYSELTCPVIYIRYDQPVIKCLYFQENKGGINYIVITPEKVSCGLEFQKD
jgi:hypothetical protein